MEYNKDLGEFDITLIRGVSETIRFWNIEKVDETGSVVKWDITGKTIRVHFKSDPCNSNPDLEKTVNNGGVVIYEDSFDIKFGIETLDLSNEVYLYDILVIDGDERYTIVHGKLILTGVITK
ncbi:hypothetical protein [Sphingobacterium multivorum]|uniref:hypothetical protein n=1 Tax=Sphingobacterium multivorum TaxID=28454 RepID=UPI003DA3BFA4